MRGAMFFLVLQLLPLFTTFTAATHHSQPKQPPYLNLTAISAKNGVSTIECWQLAAPFITSSEAGVSGASFAQLGKAGNTSYALIPAKFDGGLHNAPTVQSVVPSLPSMSSRRKQAADVHQPTDMSRSSPVRPSYLYPINHQ